MKKLTALLALLLLGNFLCAQEWRVDEYPDFMNFAFENGYYKYEKVDIQDIPKTAMAALQRAKELYTSKVKDKISYVEDDPKYVIESLKRVRVPDLYDIYDCGGSYTWFMNGNYMYMYVSYPVYVKDNKHKHKYKRNDMYYLVTALR